MEVAEAPGEGEEGYHLVKVIAPDVGDRNALRDAT
jgi:hypothetical protein